ncbi:MAG: AraC family transcriptional regulator ligand-binding domain-containing protein [Deltaproteobacteria bacterium]|nr:AraC family transcriptional regulator ligand-binding domain-containing protein [Deltaproteobacteria bacterium]MBP7288419.1 AraC family transcriptional regulator ligand-binding domain-containing protein [Nannocystaceae bacterium]
MSEPMRTPLPPLLVDRLRAAGCDPQVSCEAAGLPWPLPDGTTIVAPIDALERFYALAAAALGDDDLGLHLVASVPRGAYGLFEFGVRASATLREGLDRLCRTMALFNRVAQLQWSQVGGLARCEMLVPGRVGDLGRHANEFFIALLVAWTHASVIEPLPISQVWFSHASPGGVLAEHRRVLGCDALEFGASTCGFAFDALRLDVPLREADPALGRVIDEHARGLADTPTPPLTFELQRTLRALPRLDAAGLRSIARRLGHSSRSLQRHLAADGTSFRRVVDEVRRERLVVLQRDGVALEQIAAVLGFSDVRALRRAQQRWG